MSIINSQPLIGAAGQSTGFKIERSLRFNSADSAYLNRTFGSGNRQVFTWSSWIKLGKVPFSSDGYVFSSRQAASDNFGINITTGSKIQIDGAVSSTGFQLTTTQVFRDPSAWYHVVVAIDTTQATASNRFKLYVNGSQVTDFSTATYPSQNANLAVNLSTAVHNISGYNSSSNYIDGYMTEVNFIDGQALTPSSFGETDTDTGVWKPKAYSGSYGTNGFYLKFADNSGTTSTTLGKDSSGNGNNWTPNNFSVTAGAGNDSLVDTPTPYGTDTGAGGEVRGNYATWNALKTYNATYSNGNLDVSVASTGGGADVGLGGFGMSSGKWYWEITCNSINAAMIGISDASAAPSLSSYVSPGGWAYYSGAQRYNNNSPVSYGATYANGDVIGVALDMDAGTLVFYKNGVSQGTAYNTGLTGKTMIAMVGTGSAAVTQTYTANFGQRPFAYTAPSGFKALCTQNLPTPTIGATATTRADDYFNTVLYSSTALQNLSITGVGFQPDFVWLKCRNQAFDNALYDAVRGTTKELISNATSAETTESTGLTAFNSDGFSVGSRLTGPSNNYVAWNWNAGGSNQTISVSQYSSNVPSIASTVRANTTAGFSIVTYTGNGTSGATVGHGLGAVPQMIIAKTRNTLGDWPVYHVSIGNTKNLLLNTTGAETTSSSWWNNTTPTSTLVTLGNNSYINGNTDTFVMYCFAPVAGYSAFGSYTGNGSTDGPFVYTGFRPKFVLWKNTTSGTTNSWYILDSSRSPYNVAAATLAPNTNAAEDAAWGADGIMDFLSNGFKIRRTPSDTNVSTNVYIYAAFAEVPQKFSLAR